MDRLISWVQQNPSTNIPILVAVIGVCSALLAGFFTVVIWPLVRVGLERFWYFGKTRISRRGFEEIYLRRLIRRYRHLPMLPTTLVPVTDRPSQELDDLYVELEVTDGDDRTTEISSMGVILKNNKKIVIMGDPGAGKTTMLQYLALTFARAMRNQSFDSDASDITEEQAAINSARHAIRTDFGFSKYPLPILVFLNRFRSVLEWDESRSILDAIQEELRSNDILRGIPEGFFENYLERGRCIFFFDAFDELGTKEARDAIAKRVGDLATAAPQGNAFVVTSRIIGYEGQLNEYGFQTVTVQPLSPDLTKNLIRKWYDALGEPLLAEDLVRSMAENPRLAELAVNPMLLSLIVLVQYVRRVIPDRRHVLYDECLKILVERRYAPPNVQAEYNKILPGDEAITILRHLANRYHVEKLREIPRQRLEDEYIPSVIRAMPFSQASVIAPKVLLENIEARSQLLVERGFDSDGQPVIAFSHLTFQEYLTSTFFKEATTVKGESVVSRELIAAYEGDPDWWQEVAVLYAAQLDGSQRETFFQRLRQ